MEAAVEAPKRVKVENFNELPSSAQVYFFIHKAKDAGEEFATIPIRRGVAAIGIKSIREERKTYRQAIKSLRTAIAMRRGTEEN